MRAAVALGRRGLGNAWPNPAVGCVIVHERVAVGRGWTAPGGRPHAETEALARCGTAARGATAYVTLEPCAHHGETPPCAEALIEAGIARVVVACRDPDPRVDGRGIDRLAAAGIAVETGLCADEAEEGLIGFLTRLRRGRPAVTLKLATTLDGRIATRTGESRWITGEAARRSAHMLRARHDAILVGAATARRDDPSLTCRLPGLDRLSPVRVVVDGREPLPATHELVAGAGRAPTWFMVARPRAADRARAYGGSAAAVEPVEPDGDGNVDLAAALGALAARGITSVLVEGGGKIAAALLGAGLVDRLLWYRAPLAIGGDGRPAVAGLGVDALDAAPHFVKIASRPVGDDVEEIYRPARTPGG
ncbi:MAG: bifunctional diaminohydroxyphosphoribosylaminopyrimidine deaminase/5-amino-6-(5-phosphoribosylamino)uracil reductase RibD [Defluviicoccus sp.]|nr:bifunctional diaminohydroxyphosphoribosylaminopyrimidine deaminase/5-amino-6-(5-phosphoribosylamino)uracil reductase RibD [Defluviicoccus sp.]